MNSVSAAIVLSGLLLVTTASLSAQDDVQAEFGADANPTGQPVGGGNGYSAGPKPADAKFQVGTLDELIAALKQARSGDLIWIKSESTIDFTGKRLEVPAKVTVAGDRGRTGSLGPLLTTKHSGDDYFITLGDEARVSGLRIRGSNPLFKDLDSRESDPSGYAVLCVNSEVDNCEISQFRRGGVALFRTSDRSRIHHNYFHDIAAYPVLIGNGTGDGHVIEANRIEWAWHAVGSNGSRGSGYIARFNEFIRVVRPKQFEVSGPSPPNWCLDVHDNDGSETRPPRPATRKLIVHHNSFLAHPDIIVGDGSELLTTNGLYPKYDIFVGAGPAVTTTVEIHHNRFLMHKSSASREKFKPYGLAIRVVGIQGHAVLLDDPLPSQGKIAVTIGENKFSGQ